MILPMEVAFSISQLWAQQLSLHNNVLTKHYKKLTGLKGFIATISDGAKLNALSVALEKNLLRSAQLLWRGYRYKLQGVVASWRIEKTDTIFNRTTLHIRSRIVKPSNTK